MLTSTTAQKNEHSLFPPGSYFVSQCKNEIILTLPCFHKKWKFLYREQFSKLGACSLN